MELGLDVLGQSGGVEDFLGGEGQGVALGQGDELLVGLAEGLDAGGDARIAELGQDEVGQLFKH